MNALIVSAGISETVAYLHPILTITDGVTPVIAGILVTRYKGTAHWTIWLFGSAFFGWIFLMWGDSAYYSDLVSQYDRNRDPELLERITSDSGSGMLKALGVVVALIWSATVFGFMVIIRRIFRAILDRLKIA